MQLRALGDFSQARFLPALIADATRWVAAHRAILEGGVLLHGAAVQTESGAVLIGMGPSGAGKTTFSRFFKRSSGYRILTDETTLVFRASDGALHAYGTPWPGMIGTGINAGGPLRGIFFLEKTPKHVIRGISAPEALVRLTRELFLPPWNEEITEAALEAGGKMIEEVPTRALGFRKDISVVPFIRSAAPC